MSKKNTTTTKFEGNIFPNFITRKTRSDGKTDTIFGRQGDKNHGHSVRRANGTVEYSRTNGGREVK